VRVGASPRINAVHQPLNCVRCPVYCYPASRLFYPPTHQYGVPPPQKPPRQDTTPPPSDAMDACYRSAASARSAWWRPTTDALGIQQPLVTVECSHTGGGKLTTCFANGNDAVAALTTAFRLAPPAAEVRFDVIAPTLVRAVATTYAVNGSGPWPATGAAAAATQPSVALYDGIPASMVERWPTPDAMLAAIMPATGGVNHAYAMAASSSATAPPMAPRWSATAAAMAFAAAGRAGDLAATATAAYRARLPPPQPTVFYQAPTAAGVPPYPAAAAHNHQQGLLQGQGRRFGPGIVELLAGQVVGAVVTHCIEGML